jgi:hypothetical protein
VRHLLSCHLEKAFFGVFTKCTGRGRQRNVIIANPGQTISDPPVPSPCALWMWTGTVCQHTGRNGACRPGNGTALCGSRSYTNPGALAAENAEHRRPSILDSGFCDLRSTVPSL